MWRALTLSIFLVAATKPEHPSTQVLDYLVIEVNGQSQIIKNGGELGVIEGDKINIRNAVAANNGVIKLINLLGYFPPGAKGIIDERNMTIDTGKDLDKKSSRDSKGKIYFIKAKDGTRTLGVVRVRINRPELRYAVCLINGKDKILRPGDALKVKKTDNFKLKRVESNLSELNEDVTFDIVPVNESKNTPELEHFEIQFSRTGSVFARIPLEVEGT